MQIVLGFFFAPVTHGMLEAVAELLWFPLMVRQEYLSLRGPDSETFFFSQNKEEMYN